MRRWRTTIAAVGAATVLAMSTLVTAVAFAADRTAANPPQRLDKCSMHAALMDCMHDAMGGDAMHGRMPDGGMMNGQAPR